MASGGGAGQGAGAGHCGACVFSSWCVCNDSASVAVLALPRTALLPQPHPRQSALLGPIHIETLALCRIFPEGLRSSVGLLSRVWRGVFGRVWRALPHPPPPFLPLAVLQSGWFRRFDGLESPPIPHHPRALAPDVTSVGTCMLPHGHGHGLGALGLGVGWGLGLCVGCSLALVYCAERCPFSLSLPLRRSDVCVILRNLGIFSCCSRAGSSASRRLPPPPQDPSLLPASLWPCPAPKAWSCQGTCAAPRALSHTYTSS